MKSPWATAISDGKVELNGKDTGDSYIIDVSFNLKYF